MTRWTGLHTRWISALSLCLLCLATTPRVNAAECETYPVSPTGTVLVAKPSVTWKLIPGAGSRIAKATVTIDNVDVPASYVVEKQSVIYNYSEPAAVGTHTVYCHVTFDDDTDIEKTWSFTVPKNAISALPDPTALQKSAALRLNAYRKAVGLPPLVVNPALCAAALAHSAYLKNHQIEGHEELDSQPDFVGKGPADRVAAFGYTSASYEDLSYGTSDINEVMRQLFDAPYHRTPFLQPGASEIGVGITGTMAALEFGVTSETGVTYFPAEGTPVPTLAWTNRETPNPLRMWNAPETVGYPITFTFFSAELEGIKVADASVTTSGRTVPIFLNTPANDDKLTNGAILFPKSPLLPNKTYTVRVTAATASGRDISRTWTFTTTSTRQASNTAQ